MPGVQRWRFRDLKTGEQYTVPLNPNAMTSPYPSRKFAFNSTTAGPDGVIVSYETHADPVQWTFSGDILDSVHFDALVRWSRKRNRIQITDHYGRVFTVTVDNFNPVPKRAYGKPWRHTYVVTASVYSMLDASVPPPTVIAVTPYHGSAGTTVSITGLNFAYTSAVHFGANAAVFTVNSDSSITAQAPTGSGNVAVTVTTPKGDGSGSFHYSGLL